MKRMASLGVRVGMVQAGVVLAGMTGCAILPCEPAALAYAGSENGQVYAMRFDACAGRLDALGTVADVPKPRWIVAHPERPWVYVASEGKAKEGSVVAFSVDRASAALAPLNEAAAGGAGTTHLWLDEASDTLLTANFAAGTVASLPVGRDGRLDPVVATIKASGSGPHRRQASPHAHGVAVDPSGRFVLVADMGADRLFVYGFDRGTRMLAADAGAEPRSLALPAGSGPRHFVFDASGRFVYLLNELSADLMALRWDAQRGRLALVQTLSTSSTAFQGAPSASEIALSRDGRFVYVANRSENTIVVYRVQPGTGELRWVQRVSSGGELPWTFALHGSGRWMLVANHRSNRINLLSIEPDTGMLADTGQSVAAPAPLSLAIIP
jgi:6-phosphogluconolactonase